MRVSLRPFPGLDALGSRCLRQSLDGGADGRCHECLALALLWNLVAVDVRTVVEVDTSVQVITATADR
jgi:hypothetical protein